VLGAVWAFGIVLAAALGMAVAPQLSSRLLAKEGPAEVVQHLLLALGVLGWGGLSSSGSRRALWVAAFLGVLLGEELDWGGVLAGGGGNLHNALGGHSYFLFALPLLVLFGAPRRWVGEISPDLPERVGFFGAVGVVAAAATILVPAWEAAFDEAKELALYGLLVAVSLRLHRARRASAKETARSTSSPSETPGARR